MVVSSLWVGSVEKYVAPMHILLASSVTRQELLHKKAKDQMGLGCLCLKRSDYYYTKLQSLAFILDCLMILNANA
jgi:hypothetical protein